MANSNRNLLVLFVTGKLDDRAIELEAGSLNKILADFGSSENFYNAHELVNRNRITSRKKTILRETSYRRLRPFRFLLNRN